MLPPSFSFNCRRNLVSFKARLCSFTMIGQTFWDFHRIYIWLNIQTTLIIDCYQDVSCEETLNKYRFKIFVSVPQDVIFSYTYITSMTHWCLIIIHETACSYPILNSICWLSTLSKRCINRSKGVCFCLVKVLFHRPGVLDKCNSFTLWLQPVVMAPWYIQSNGLYKAPQNRPQFIKYPTENSFIFNEEYKCEQMCIYFYKTM